MEQPLACAPAIRIFDRLLRGFDAPPALRLWNDALHMPSGSPAVFTLVLRDPRLLRRLVIGRNPVLLADASFRGALDVEGDLYAALQFKGHFAAISLSWRGKLALLRDALRRPGSGEAGFKPAGNLASRLARRFSHQHSRHQGADRTPRCRLGVHRHDRCRPRHGRPLRSQASGLKTAPACHPVHQEDHS